MSATVDRNRLLGIALRIGPATCFAGMAAVIAASGLYTIYREHKLGRERVRPEPL